jgi:hypothetical protein
MNTILVPLAAYPDGWIKTFLQHIRVHSLDKPCSIMWRAFSAAESLSNSSRFLGRRHGNLLPVEQLLASEFVSGSPSPRSASARRATAAAWGLPPFDGVVAQTIIPCISGPAFLSETNLQTDSLAGRHETLFDAVFGNTDTERLPRL